MKMKRIASLALILLLTVATLTGCGGSDTSTDAAYLSVIGSTSVTPVATELAAAYMEANPDVKIDVQGIGSSAGVKAAYDKTADIGMSSRNLKEAEQEWNLTETVIAYDGIAVAVHPDNPVDGLTLEQVAAIFRGEITNWSELGGNDEEIIVVSREDGSGTRGAFEEIVGLEEKDADGNTYSGLVIDALIAEGNGAVKANVASKTSAIGYLSLSYLDASVKTVTVDGVEPTVEQIKAGAYGISRPFLMLTNAEASDLAQDFLAYILADEGQAIVGEKLITVR